MLNQKAQDNKKTYTVAEIADMLGIGRTSAYNLVKENHFKVVKIGASIRISKKSFDDWLDKLNRCICIERATAKISRIVANAITVNCC